jgi:hypothetical protein
MDDGVTSNITSFLGYRLLYLGQSAGSRIGPLVFILVELRTKDRPDRPNRPFANWPGGMDGPDGLIRGFGKELDN